VVHLHGGPVGGAAREEDRPESGGWPAGKKENRHRLQKGQELAQSSGHQADRRAEKQRGPGGGFLGEKVDPNKEVEGVSTVFFHWFFQPASCRVRRRKLVCSEQS
jgi:hypothetical protein